MGPHTTTTTLPQPPLSLPQLPPPSKRRPRPLWHQPITTLTCTTTVSTMAFTTAITMVFITDTHLTPLTLDTEELIPMLIMVSILTAITVMVSTPTLLPPPPLLQPLPHPQAKNKPKD